MRVIARYRLRRRQDQLLLLFVKKRQPNCNTIRDVEHGCTSNALRVTQRLAVEIAIEDRADGAHKILARARHFENRTFESDKPVDLHLGEPNIFAIEIGE